MMQIRDVKRPGTVSIGASETNTVISTIFTLNRYQANEAFKAAVVCSSVTETTGFTFKLQHSYDGGSTWADVGNQFQGTLSTGVATIRGVVNDATDAAQMPIWPVCRIVVSSGSSDALTVDNIYVSGFDN